MIRSPSGQNPTERNMNTIDKIKKIALVLAASIIVAAAFLLFNQKGAFLSDSINWQDGDFAFEEGEVRVKNRSAAVYYKGGRVWKSAWDVNVQQCASADIDRDGHDELIMLVWKRGSYGSHMPFWVDKNDNELAQHIFIYKWEHSRTSKLRAIWMSSAVSDNFDYLSTGGNGEVIISDTDGGVKAWIWEGFGLKLLGGNCKTVDYIALGDQLLHIPVIRRGMNTGDYSYMYENIADEVRKYDIASLNQETVYVDDRGLVSDYPSFGSPREVAGAVCEAGIDIVSLANNHALDKGSYGIDCSIKANNENGIVTIGVHGKDEESLDSKSAVWFMDVNGIRLALLNFTYGTNGKTLPEDGPYAVELFSNENRLTEALDYAREEADCVIVYAHWGTEYSSEVDEFQTKYKEIFMDHGVDVVIGTHPHVVQPMEYLHDENHNMLIYYSLGNLISNQDREECLEGEAASFKIVKISDKKTIITDYETKPLKTVKDKVIWAD